MAKRTPRFDRRLIGTWKSDRRRTMKSFHPRPGCSLAALKRFAALFGKLVVRWGSGRYEASYDGHVETGTYEVVARDSVSVVIRSFDTLAKEERLRHLHFDGNHYWMVLGTGTLCEFFRRV